MATNWPTSRDTFTNPSSGDTLDNPSHAAQHANINDAVEAMQAHAGLVLVKPSSAVNGTVGANGAVTIGTTVSSVTVNDAFSSTFDNYKITINIDALSAAPYITLQLSGSTTGYYLALNLTNYSGTTSGIGRANQSSWDYLGPPNQNGGSYWYDLFYPNKTERTVITGHYVDMNTGGSAGSVGGIHNVASAFTGFVVGLSSGTMTGGTIRVYGYNNG